MIRQLDRKAVVGIKKLFEAVLFYVMGFNFFFFFFFYLIPLDHIVLFERARVLRRALEYECAKPVLKWHSI